MIELSHAFTLINHFQFITSFVISAFTAFIKASPYWAFVLHYSTHDIRTLVVVIFLLIVLLFFAVLINATSIILLISCFIFCLFFFLIIRIVIDRSQTRELFILFQTDLDIPFSLRWSGYDLTFTFGRVGCDQRVRSWHMMNVWSSGLPLGFSLTLQSPLKIIGWSHSFLYWSLIKNVMPTIS